MIDRHATVIEFNQSSNVFGDDRSAGRVADLRLRRYLDRHRLPFPAIAVKRDRPFCRRIRRVRQRHHEVIVLPKERTAGAEPG